MRNTTIKLLIGLPGSGKTTWCKNFLKSNPSWVRVNRDDFRFMLKDQPKCEPKIEDLITELSDEAIFKSLKRGLNVVLDNTNLNTKRIEAFIEKFKYHANIEFMLFDVPMQTCLERDAAREKKVGEGVIRKMAKDYRSLCDTFHFQNVTRVKANYIVPDHDHPLPHAVIFDIDGTLANMGNRGPFDWQKVDRDSAIKIVIEQAEFHKNMGRRIILFSGRDSECRELTKEWLKFYDVKYDELYMRPQGDFRKDSIIKEELYRNHIDGKYNVLCVYDDRLQVVKKWHEMGIFVFCVNQGLIDF